jgi:hypothetical protein
LIIDPPAVSRWFADGAGEASIHLPTAKPGLPVDLAGITTCGGIRQI